MSPVASRYSSLAEPTGTAAATQILAGDRCLCVCARPGCFLRRRRRHAGSACLRSTYCTATSTAAPPATSASARPPLQRRHPNRTVVCSRRRHQRWRRWSSCGSFGGLRSRTSPKPRELRPDSPSSSPSPFSTRACPCSSHTLRATSTPRSRRRTSRSSTCSPADSRWRLQLLRPSPSCTAFSASVSPSRGASG